VAHKSYPSERGVSNSWLGLRLWLQKCQNPVALTPYQLRTIPVLTSSLNFQLCSRRFFFTSLFSHLYFLFILFWFSLDLSRLFMCFSPQLNFLQLLIFRIYNLPVTICCCFCFRLCCYNFPLPVTAQTHARICAICPMVITPGASRSSYKNV